MNEWFNLRPKRKLVWPHSCPTLGQRCNVACAHHAVETGAKSVQLQWSYHDADRSDVLLIDITMANHIAHQLDTERITYSGFSQVGWWSNDHVKWQISRTPLGPLTCVEMLSIWKIVCAKYVMVIIYLSSLCPLYVYRKRSTDDYYEVICMPKKGGGESCRWSTNSDGPRVQRNAFITWQEERWGSLMLRASKPALSAQ